MSSIPKSTQKTSVEADVLIKALRKKLVPWPRYAEKVDNPKQIDTNKLNKLRKALSSDGIEQNTPSS